MRRLSVLVEGLPADAPLWREDVREAREANRWSQDHELLAEILENLDQWGYRIFSASGGKLKGKYKPLRFPRPGDPDRKVKLANQATIARFFMVNG